MSTSRFTLERIARTGGYLLLGLVATAAVAVGSLWVTQPLQVAIYAATYGALGPVDATGTATLGHFLTAMLVGIGTSTLLGATLADRIPDVRVLAAGVVAVVAAVAAFLGLALVGLQSALAALLVLGVVVVGLPAALRYRVRGRSGSVPAFAGGLPVLALMVLLAGFGLGWGWGYVLTATEVPPSTADGTVADFEPVPAVSEDLFAADNCEQNATGARRCLLQLRGYEHERAATRFLARHGVRCPYVNAQAPEPPDSFLARHDGTLYRVSCHGHGD